MRKLLFGLVMLFATLQLRSQDDVFEAMKKRFPDAPAVYVERSETLNLTVDGDSVRVQSDVFDDMLHLKDQTDAFSGRRVYGSHFTKIENLKARTLAWEKNKYKEIRVLNFSKNSDRSSGIFYDDSFYYGFDFPTVAAKNRTQLSYSEIHTDPKFVSGFVFASYVPQAKTSYVIKVTGEVDLMYQVLNDPGKQIRFRKYFKGKSIYYEWVAENLSALKSEEDSPSIRYYAPHVICYVKSFRTKNKNVRVLADVNDLYTWYYSFVKDLNQQHNAELSSIVEKIKASSKDEVGVVRNVFYWVQQNIQYVAFEQGMRGLIPHSGAYVCEKRYGDCKDMANLIVNMLTLANIKSYHTWIGTRNLPYRYSDVPTPLVDDHMIATYISPTGEYYFLDATSDYTTFGYPSAMIQGKEALIGKGPDSFEIRTVPIVDKKMNITIDSMMVHIDENVIAGFGTSSLTGYPKVWGSYELDRPDADDVKKYVTKLVGKGSNKFFLDKYSLANIENRDSPTKIKYNFRISDYFQTIGDEIYINLNLNKDFYNSVINTEIRKSPKEQDYAYTKYEFVELTMPDGYGLEYLPENSKNDGKLLGYEITYEMKENKILFTKKLYVDYLLMQPAEFVSWNNDVKKVSEAYKESIIIKKNK